ncbi:MAG: hypothetical protein A4E30_00248 [Methanomassiliicoccales archaeon PtaB.Bin215]|nr:MAG: hypothetical protein A4E30_00248 [Methanomassiliicoccales archaeon PtaB.Bin215]
MPLLDAIAMPSIRVLFTTTNWEPVTEIPSPTTLISLSFTAMKLDCWM